MNRRPKLLAAKRKAIGYNIAVVWLTFILFTLLYIPLNLVMTQFNNFQQTVYPQSSGVYDPSTLTFMQDAWTMLMLVVLLSGGLHLWNAAQKEGRGEIGP